MFPPTKSLLFRYNQHQISVYSGSTTGCKTDHLLIFGVPMPVIVSRDRTCGLFRASTSIWYVPFQIHMAFCSSSSFHPFLSGPSFHVTTGGRKTVRCGGPLASTRGGRDSVFLDWCLRFWNNKQFQSTSLFTTGTARKSMLLSGALLSFKSHDVPL